MSKNELVLVDLGNYNTKYAGSNTGVFSSAVDTRFNANKEMFQYVEMDNKTTLIGVGKLEKEFDKTSKRNYKALLMYAIAKATDNANIDLCLLLPVSLMSQKQKYIDELQYKTFRYVCNGKSRVVAINKVIVLPEGYTAFYSLSDKTKDTLLLDLGGMTCNVASFIGGKVENNFTVKVGMNSLYERIQVLEASKGNDFKLEDISRLIKSSIITVQENIYKEFLMELLNEVKQSINIKAYPNVVFSGGGATELEEFIKKYTPCTLTPNPIMANLEGAKAMCNAMGLGVDK